MKWLFFLMSVISAEKKIVLTIDDDPLPSSLLFTPSQRAEAISDIIQKQNLPPVGIFVIGENLQKFGDASLKVYEKNPNIVLGNHSFSHRRLREVSLEFFKNDVQKCHDLLLNYSSFRPLFRYPYLSKGKEGVFEQAEAFLKSLGYQTIPGTICTQDTYLNQLFLEAQKKGKPVNLKKLEDLYVSYILSYFSVYEPDETKTYTLILHANDLTALFLEPLVLKLRENGWAFQSVLDQHSYYDIDFDFFSGKRKFKTKVRSNLWLEKEFLKTIFG